MTKTTSRQRILGYLGQHNGSSATEISRSLRVSAADARYHLSLLVLDGRVQVLGSRSEQSRGRPVRIYGLGKAALGDNLSILADALLGLVYEKSSETERDALLQGLAGRLVPGRPDGQGHISLRLAQVTTQLNRCGYSARWEAHAAAPRIIFEGCPYSAVIDRHPELCQMDNLILAKQLGRQVEQTERLEKNARGTRYCQFELK